MDHVVPVLIAVVAIIAVWVSLARHPLRECRKCEGTGKVRSALIPGRYRPCPRCGRRGETSGPLGRKDN